MIPLCDYPRCESPATLAAETVDRFGEVVTKRACGEHIHYLWGYLQSASRAGETIRVLEGPR